MMSLLFSLFLTFNATILIVVVYLIKSNVVILNGLSPYFANLPNFASYVIYLLIPIALTYLSLQLSRRLPDDSIEQGRIIGVEQANNAYLPSYLGYFFIALSVPNYETLGYVYFILFFFTFFSQTLYFNPLFLLFGYHFYYITTTNNVKLLLITKEKLKCASTIDLPHLKRINDFTFINLPNNRAK